MSIKSYKNNIVYNIQYGSITSTTEQKAYQCTFGGTIDEHSFLRVTYTNVKETQNGQDYFKGSSKVKVAEFSAISLDGVLLKDFDEVVHVAVVENNKLQIHCKSKYNSKVIIEVYTKDSNTTYLNFEEINSTVMIDYREAEDPVNLEYHATPPVNR